jgi:hypothetical protein
MTTDAIALIAGNQVVDYGAVVYQSGATGDGIHILSNHCVLNEPSVIGVGKATPSGNGIRVGKDVAGANCNSWRVNGGSASGLSGHGLYVHDKPGAAPDANAGNAIGFFGNNNGGDGIRCDNAEFNNFVGCLGESNTGNGITLGNTSLRSATNQFCRNNFVIGGDYEANTAAQLVLNQSAIQCGVMVDEFQVTVTDNGYFTKHIGNTYGRRTAFTPGIVGASGVDKAPTSVTITGSTATISVAAHGYGAGSYVWHRGFSGAGLENLNGVFAISNITGGTYDITIRSDVTSFQPSGTTSSGMGTVRQAGVYSAANGFYELHGDKCFFEAFVTTTALTNITGSVQVVLPFAPVSLAGGNLAGDGEIFYYSGITHTGKLALYLAQNGAVNQNILNAIGSTLTPAQLGAAGLAAATTIAVSGWFFWQ